MKLYARCTERMKEEGGEDSTDRCRTGTSDQASARKGEPRERVGKVKRGSGIRSPSPVTPYFGHLVGKAALKNEHGHSHLPVAENHLYFGCDRSLLRDGR